MHNKSPLVSIILCYYNAEDYLKRCLEALIGQSYSNFEIIALNDGSIDSSQSIIQEFADQDARIKMYSQKNTGLTIALNQAIQKATGKYLARQDADDISLPQRLEKQVQFLEQYPEYFLVGSHFLDYDTKNDTLQETSLKTIPLENVAIKKALPLYNCFCHSSVMFRNDLSRIHSFYDETFTYAQDYELWVRISKHHKMANLKETLVHRAILEDAISSKRYKAQRYHAVRAKLRSFHLQPSIVPFFTGLCKDFAVMTLPKNLLAILKALR